MIELLNFQNVLLFCITFSLLVFQFITISNYFYTGKFTATSKSLNKHPSVDILIPARNEESNINEILQSLSELNYPNFKVIIADDNSEDKTAEIAETFISKSSLNISLIKISKKPKKWIGKNYACHMLSKKSKSEYILFLDADCRLEKSALSFAIEKITEEELSLLSIFPSQKYSSFSVKLIVPLMNWLLLSLLKLKKVFTSNSPAFTAANGQFMLFKKESYIKIGGHSSVKENYIEDIALAKNIKRHSLKMRAFTSNNIVNCKMYNSFSEALGGFSKNFYPGFNLPAPIFFLLIFALLTCFLFPLILIFQDIRYVPALVLIISNRIVVSIISKESVILNLFLHPVQMAVLLYGGAVSFIKSKLGKLKWKGRNL